MTKQCLPARPGYEANLFNAILCFLSLYSSLANPAIIAGAPFFTAHEGFQGNLRNALQPFVSGSPFPSVDQGTWLFNRKTNYPPGTSQVARDFILSSNLTLEHSGIYSYYVVTKYGGAIIDFNVTVISECLTFRHWC